MRAIIPCAGYGTRMNMAPDKSKEMLEDPKTGESLITYSLKLCLKHDIEPLVITRAEKTDLIAYCNTWGIKTQIIVPEGEWMDTVLMSQPHWDKHNVLILPDTKFEPTNVLRDIKRDLSFGANSSIALHSVDDADKWCILRQYNLIEKPKNYPGKQWAFGLIGFTDFSGYGIFKQLKDEKIAMLDRSSFHYLEDFKDLTRAGKIGG
jgi:dTDP-glucose pyrophosphorylase